MVRIVSPVPNWVQMDSSVLAGENAKEVVREKATVSVNVTEVSAAKLVINVLKASTKMRLAKTTTWSAKLAIQHALTSAPVPVQPNV